MKKTKKTLLKELRDCAKKLVTERDKMREIIDEYESIACDCDDAILSLEDAADALSRSL